MPSYATAIGSSGDNPAALSTLMGIVVNGGVRYPSLRIDQVHFAAGTPYDTRLTRTLAGGERVLSPAVASLVRGELVGVVEGGTGRRLAGGVRLGDGRRREIGGKTGTGDNRFVTGRTSRVVNRTAAFSADRARAVANISTQDRKISASGNAATSAHVARCMRRRGIDCRPMA